MHRAYPPAQDFADKNVDWKYNLIYCYTRIKNNMLKPEDQILLQKWIGRTDTSCLSVCLTGGRVHPKKYCLCLECSWQPMKEELDQFI